MKLIKYTLFVLPFLSNTLLEAMKPQETAQKSWDQQTLAEKKAWVSNILKQYGFQKWKELLSDANVTDNQGDTPLLYTVKNKTDSVETDRVITTLLDSGANINFVNAKDGLTPLGAAIDEGVAQSLTDYAKAHNMRLVKGTPKAVRPLPKVPTVVVPEPQGKATALIAAPKPSAAEKSWSDKTIAEKKDTVADDLKSNGYEKWKEFLSNVDIKDSKGDTPLLFIARTMPDSTFTNRDVDFLLSQKAQINYVNPKDGSTPLLAALVPGGKRSKANVSLAEKLVKEGADVNVRRKSDGATPFSIASQDPNLHSLLPLLIVQGAKSQSN